MNWQFDPGHTYIGFTGRHLMVATVRGEFVAFTGSVTFDAADLAHAQATIEIDAASVTTHNADRDAHFRSSDFFDTDHYPTIRFQSRRVVLAAANQGQVIGDLTIRGITREVVLTLNYTGVQQTPWGTESAGFSLRGTVNRKDWGLTWNALLAAGGLVAGDEIGLVIDLELTRPLATPAEVALVGAGS